MSEFFALLHSLSRWIFKFFQNWRQKILSNEILVKVGFFLGVLTIVAIWELVAPRRALTTSKPIRWRDNLIIVFIDSVIVRLLIPITLVAVALLLQERNWGVLNFLNIPYWATVMMGVIVLDLAVYLQHVMFHAVPVLWRLHMMHHADLDFDLTTGLRFQPAAGHEGMTIGLSQFRDAKV
jgi:sterol desaturase/sphingolipid hydroxylase (fatty acid hydroxylase superfamily)